MKLSRQSCGAGFHLDPCVGSLESIAMRNWPRRRASLLSGASLEVKSLRLDAGGVAGRCSCRGIPS